MGTPTNLGAKVNSPGKDNSLMVAPRGGVAMFATTRNSGNLDFWEVVLPEEAQPIEVATLRGWCWMRPQAKRSRLRWP